MHTDVLLITFSAYFDGCFLYGRANVPYATRSDRFFKWQYIYSLAHGLVCGYDIVVQAFLHTDLSAAQLS